MKRKRWQHGGQPKHLPFQGLPLLLASDGITLPLSRYQRDFTPYQAQNRTPSQHRGLVNEFGRRRQLRDDVTTEKL